MNRFALRSILLIVPAAILYVGPLGCSKKGNKVDVTGKVTYNGQAIEKPGGTIIFVGPDGTTASAEIGLDGSYSATGVAIGDNKVAVSYPNQAGGAAPATGKKPRFPGPDAGKVAAAPEPYVTPPEYADAETSQLTVKVEKGTVYNPTLSGPPIK
jgi:hypothetical protein